MSDPCEQQDSIAELQRASAIQSGKMDTVLQNQEITATTIAKYFERLEIILMTEVEHRKDIEQMKQNDERLFEKNREFTKTIAQLTAYQNACETLDIKGKVKVLHEASIEKKGVKHYSAQILAGLALVITVLSFAFKYITITP